MRIYFAYKLPQFIYYKIYMSSIYRVPINSCNKSVKLVQNSRNATRKSFHVSAHIKSSLNLEIFQIAKKRISIDGYQIDQHLKSCEWCLGTSFKCVLVCTFNFLAFEAAQFFFSNQHVDFSLWKVFLLCKHMRLLMAQQLFCVEETAQKTINFLSFCASPSANLSANREFEFQQNAT